MRKLFIIITAGVCLCFASIPKNVDAALLYWDNNGASAATGGVWNTSSAQWAPSGTLTASTAAWNNASGATTAAVFCAGTTSPGAIAITVNSAITVAGIFNGALTPPGCTLTISGTGSLNFGSGTQGIDTAGSNGDPTTINVPIIGTAQIETEGGNQLYLNATNTYSGGTLLGGTGIVNFNNAGSFGTGPITMLASGGALVAEGTTPINITNSWVAAATSLNIVANPAGVTFSGPWNLAVTPNIGSGVAGNVLILSGIMSGAGGFNKYNPAILRLSGANTYTGLTTVSNGILQLGVAGGFPSGAGKGNMGVYTPGVLDVNGLSGNVNALVGNGTITNSTGTGTLTIGNNNQTSQFDGNIANATGTLNITKAGTGVLTLTGTNTYNGATLVTNGTLKMGGLKIVPLNSPLTIASAAFLDVNSNTAPLLGSLFGNGTIIHNTHTLTISNNFSTGATLSTYSTFSGVLASGNLFKDGTSSLSLRGANTNTASTTTVNAGTLSVGAAPNRLPVDNTLSIATGALFQLDANNQTLAALAGTGNINLDGQLTLTGSANSFSGTIQDSELPGVPTDVGHGLRGYYYSNQDLSSLATVRDDANVNFTDLTSPAQLPAALYPKTNNISIRWLGQVQTTAAGTYTFTTATDDGVRLWVNGTLLIDSWILQGLTPRSNTIALAANTRYDIVMEYFNQTVGAAAKLSWTPPGDSLPSIIATDYLYLPSPGMLIQASGSLVLNGASTYSGGTLISGGSVEAANPGTLGNGNVTVRNGANLIVDTGSVMSSNGDLILSTNASVDIEFLGSPTPIHGISFDGGLTYQPTGTYGSPGSGANHENPVFNGSGNGLFLVTAAPSVISLTSAGGPSIYGSSVTYTSTVTGSGATPTGTVTFYDGTSAIGTATLNGSGVATFSIGDFLATTSPHSVTAVYGGDAKFATSTSAALSQVVNPLPVSPGSVTASNKVYDATSTDSISAISLSGVLANDTNNVHLIGGTGTFTDKTVANGKTVNITGFTLAGSLAGNYTLATNATTALANITAKPLTVTGVTANNKPFDGTTNATLNLGSAALVGIIGTDNVTLNTAGAIGAFSSATVGNAKTVSVTGLALGGTDGGNYSVTPPTTTANITQGSSSSVIVSSQNPSHLNSNVTFTVTVSGPGGTPTGNVVFLTNNVALGTVALTGGVAATNTASLPLGTNTITVQYTGDATYLGITNSISQVVNTASPGSLAITNIGTNVVITWAGTFTLQGTPALMTNSPGSWTNIPGATSPFTNPITGNQFFRLSQ